MSETEPQAVYSRAKKLTQAIDYQLQQLEQDDRGAYGSVKPVATEDELSHKRAAIADNFNRLASETSLLERIVKDNTNNSVFVTAEKRELWNKRLEALSAETNSLRTTIMRYMKTFHDGQVARRDRENRQRLMAGGSTGARAVAMDSLLSERSSLSSSHTMVDEFTTLAETVRSSLREQRTMLKSAHKKVLDIASLLGLSTTLMRVIERRTTADKILVYGGVCVVIIILALIYWVSKK